MKRMICIATLVVLSLLLILVGCDDPVTPIDYNIVVAQGTTTIGSEGTYTISGEADNSQIIINVGDEDKVELVLDNLIMSNSTTAPIFVKNADNVTITLADNTTNTLTVNGEYAKSYDNIDSVIFSKSDIEFDGTGTLNIEANYGHGIVGKDDVTFTSGNYHINSQHHGITANNSINVINANFTINSGKDGIQVQYTANTSIFDNLADEELGNVNIQQGNFVIRAGQDGITASNSMKINGTFDITSGGGYDKVLKDNDSSSDSNTQSQPISKKALKAQDIVINGGQYDLSCYEDAINAQNSLTINNATMTISTGDDALHANTNILISDIDLTINNGYEGIEGETICITTGNIDINVVNNGINVNSVDGSLSINGGKLSLLSQGDAIDCDGDYIMTAGELILDTDNGKSNFDILGKVTITGGTIKDINGKDIDTTNLQ